MRHTRELVRRAERVAGAVRAWRDELEAVAPRAYLAPEQVASLLDVLDDRLMAQARALGGLDARPEAADGALRALVDTERAWQHVRHVLMQRQDPALGPMLQLADLCAADGYRAVIARTRGEVRARSAPPVVVAEAVDGPLTYVRDELLDAPGYVRHARERRRPWPMPVVLVPPDHLGCAWLLTTLQHEVGHDLNQDLGLVRDAEERIRSVVQESEGRYEQRDRWPVWADEILADLFAVALAGVAFGQTIRDVLRVLDHDPVGAPIKESGRHPPTRIRLALVSAFIRRLTGRRVELGPPAEPADARLAEAVAEALCALPAGGRARLDELVPHEVSAVHEVARRMRAPLPGTVVAVPWRALPSVAQLALDGLPHAPDDLDRIHRATLELARELPRPPWVSSDDRWTFLAEELASLEPTERVDGLKLPPVRLLVRHARAAFVGATNERLPRMIRTALSAEPGRRWEHVEVFGLSDEALSAVVDPRPSGERIGARDAAEADLLRLLRQCCDSWRIYRYDRVCFFASYWDWEARGGRIHVSPQVWGGDVQRVPGVDHLWIGPAPSATYQAYALGLAALRAEAHPVA